MSLLKITIAYLLSRPLQSVLNMLLMAFGIIIITLLLLTNHQLEQNIKNNIGEVDMVVGAKGSPMQIILSSLFHIDFPTGNIDLELANKLSQNRLIESSVPLSLGDSYQGFRIAGTNQDYQKLFELNVKEGKWPEQPMEVCVGEKVAESLQLKIGDTFHSAHGFNQDDMVHETKPYKVTGILESSGKFADKLIFTSIESYWQVHEKQDTKQITNLLIHYRNPMAAVRLPRMINNTGNLQAASPSFEASRLFSMLGVGTKFLSGLAFFIVGMATLSIFIALYNNLNEKMYDLAIMRSIGASQRQLLGLMLLEGIVISVIATSGGILLAHASIELLQYTVDKDYLTMIEGERFLFKEIYILLLGLLAGIIASVIPAWSVYNSDISSILSEGK